MADTVFNIAKGRVVHLASLPAANDALVAVVLQSTNLPSDAIMRDYANLSALLAGSADEHPVMGRKTLTNVTVSVDNSNDWVSCDADDITWTNTSGVATGALVICYRPDLTVGTDADMIPLVKLDFQIPTPTGDMMFVFNAAGFYRAA